MYENIGRSLGTDYFRIADQLTREELDYLRRTREFVDNEVLPVINGYWERAEFPWPLIERLGKLGHHRRRHRGLRLPADEPDRQRAGAHGAQPRRRQPRHLPRGAGRAGHAVDRDARLGGAETAVAARHGRAGQARRVRADRADHGSDSVALETSARRDGDAWVINGQKKWIGNGTIADVVVVWARDTADGQVKGFLVEKGTPGYDARRIDGKGSLRAVWQAEITLTDLRVPEENRLPGARSVQGHRPGAGRHPQHGRLGRARATPPPRTRSPSLLQAAAAVRQAAGELPDRAGPAGQDARRGVLDAAVLPAAGPAHRGGRATDTIAAIAKMNNTRKARQVIAEARDLLGGNGILLDFHVMRHMADIEAIHTYEGTETIQTLIVGGTSPVSAPSPEPASIRFVDVDGVRLRASVRGVPARSAAADHRLGAGLDLADPFEREWWRGVTRSSASTRRASASRRGYRCPRRMRGVARTMERLLDALGYDAGRRARGLARRRGRPAARPPGVRAGAPAGAGRHRRRGARPGRLPGSPRVLLALATPRRYRSPDYYRRSPAGSTADPPGSDPDALLHGSLGPLRPSGHRRAPATSASCTRSASGPPALAAAGCAQPTLVLSGDDDPIVPVVNGRILAR